MAKLQDDPKVKELIDKAAAKATKDEAKRLAAAAKEVVSFHVAEHQAKGDKAAVRHLTALGKTLGQKLKHSAGPLPS